MAYYFVSAIPTEVISYPFDHLGLRTAQELYSKGMLQKGLTRAGVRDADHQTLIANAVSDLEYWTPEESGKNSRCLFFLKGMRSLD